MIEIAVRKRLADFSLDVELSLPAESVAVFGPSGAGKSTLLKSVAGLLKPDSGRIAVNDRTLFDSDSGEDIPPERRALGMMPQDPLLFPHRSVRENLLFGYRRIKGRERRVRFDEVVDILEIGALLDRRPHTLSGGEAQRVALGRALLTSPRMLLFDEPLASLDARLKARILPFLRRAIEHFGLPALYVSHDHLEVTSIAKTIVVLERGRVVGAGPYLEIIDSPRVYGAFTREGIDNVISAEVVENRHEDGYSEVAAGAARLRVPPIESPPGTAVGLTVSANDIILAREKPGRISTRNVLPGRVARIADVGNLLLVHVDVGCELVVELTPEAVKELDLEPGAEAWALIKSNAFSLLS